ncbi:hypothetical protein [Streptomyces similanensis]|uniref:hypothetical protein n=1 Tax=Streptomyces similanensis TaxID=1274988 RepID=UPI0031EE5BEA
MGDQDDVVAEEWDPGPAGHEASLQLGIGNAAFIDPRVVEGGDALGYGMPVFAQGSGEALERGQSAVRKLVEPVREGCGVAVVEHVGESTDQVVSVRELRAVVEEPGQAVVDVWTSAGRMGGDPAGGFSWGGRSLVGRVHRQTSS